MRRFAQPNVIIKAVSTAAICVVLCLPRLATWKDLPNDLWFLAAMLGWCLFVLWGFVFAWEPKYGKATPFAIVREPRTWLLIPVAGAALGLFMHLFIDPDLKALKWTGNAGHRIL